MNNKAHLRPKDFDSNGDIIPMSWKEEKGDLISREALKKDFKVEELYWGKRIIDLIDNAPTVLDKEVVEETEKACKTCDYYVNKYGYGQCYGQKDAPKVDENEVCESWEKGGAE